MSCPDGVSCHESSHRLRALILFGVLILVFIALSAFSFLDSRGQVTPDQVSFGQYQALDGKKVFQAYNCMGCHTLVGNGAYFAPDLTKEYERTGPAWLMAFLGSAGHWPTEAVVKAQLANQEVAADAGVSTLEAYYEKFPGAKTRIDQRGGGSTFMPNLPFQGEEVGQLIAYLKYVSEMNTEGWPPEVKVSNPGKHTQYYKGNKSSDDSAVSTSVPVEEATGANESPAARGKKLATANACIACHSADGSKVVGPTWKGLYGSDVALADGSHVKADEAYLMDSIAHPNAQIVKGYSSGVMPAFDKILSENDMKDIVEYIRSLEK